MRDDTFQRVVDCIAATTRYPTELLTADAELENGLGIDSVKRVEIIVALGEQFGVDLTAQAAASPARTIADIADFIDGLLEKGGKSAQPVQDAGEEESPRVRCRCHGRRSPSIDAAIGSSAALSGQRP